MRPERRLSDSLQQPAAATPSPSAVKSSSETSPLRVRVSAATTTQLILAATGSRVSTSTGRSPPGVAANQTSPRCIDPVRPVFRGAPVGDPRERLLALVEGLFSPGLGVVLARQSQEMAAERVAEEFG